jgi:hypothetical protein
VTGGIHNPPVASIRSLDLRLGDQHRAKGITMAMPLRLRVFFHCLCRPLYLSVGRLRATNYRLGLVAIPGGLRLHLNYFRDEYRP